MATSWAATSKASPANDADTAGSRRTTSATSSACSACNHETARWEAASASTSASRCGADVEPGQRGTQIRPRHMFEHVY